MMDNKNNNKWYQSNFGIICLLIIFFPVGLYLMWKYSGWGSKIKYSVTGFFAFILLISALGGNKTSNPQTSTPATNKEVTVKPTEVVVPTEIPEATNTPVPKDADGFPKDAEKVTVSNLDKAPSQYTGKKVVFTCTVASFPKDKRGNAAAINCYDPSNVSAIVQVSAYGYDLTKINANDKVKIYGIVDGSATGKNAFGSTVSQTIVTGIYIRDLTSGYNEL